MTNRSLFGLVSLVAIPVLVGCSQVDVSDSSIEAPRDLTVEISGTEGLVVDLDRIARIFSKVPHLEEAGERTLEGWTEVILGSKNKQTRDRNDQLL